MDEKATPGQPLRISARVYNRMVDAANDYEQRRRLGGAVHGKPSQIDTNVIKVKNLTGGDLLRGSVVEIGSYLLTVNTDTAIDAQHRWFNGNDYAAGGNIGVLLEPIPADEIGKCQVSGVCIARVNFSDTAHRFCRPKVNESYLETSGNAGPFVILAKPNTGTGTQEAWVDLTVKRRMYWAKNGGSTIAARSGTTVSSGTVTLYYLSGSTLTSLGVTVTAYNLSATAVAANAYLNVTTEDASGVWTVTWEDCT